jgi:hypothetical protein
MVKAIIMLSFCQPDWPDYVLEVDLEGEKDTSQLSASLWQIFFSRNGGLLE